MKRNSRLFEKIISFMLLISLLLNIFAIDVFGSVSNNNVNESNSYLTEELESFSLIPSIKAFVPKNNEFLLNDLGLNNGLLADIKKVQTFSLLNKRQSNEVSLEVTSFNNGEAIDVIHFIEDPYYINEDSIVINVSHYSDESKTILGSAIDAYQEAFNTDDELVAIEIFEDIIVENNQINFQTNSFSIFVIGNVALTTYEFYVDGVLYNTQILIGNSNNEAKLLMPETPYKEHFEFLGWQIEGTTDYQEFGLIQVNHSENTTIRCDAVFNETYYVYFLYEAKENADILETLSGKPGDVIYTDQVDYPLSLDKHVVSWHTDILCESPDITSVTIGTKDLVLYPKVEKGYWVTFYTEGGSYIDPMFYGKNETIIKPEDPYREGYKFIGWFDEDGNQFIFDEQIVTESVRLTARYEAQAVSYTVQIVMQNPNKPDKYDPVLNGMFIKEGLCGETIKATDIPISEIESVINKLGNTSYFKTNLKYFYYSDASNGNEEVELESDGSSVLYIYYDRYTTELRYYFSYTDEEPWKVQSGLFDADMPSLYWLIPTEEEYSSFGNWESSPNLFPAWTGKFDYGFTWDDDKDVFVHNVYATKGAENGHYFYSYVQAINPDGTVPDVGVDITGMPYRPHVDYYNPDYDGNEGNQALVDNWSNIDFGTASKDEITNNDTWLLYESQNLPFIANMEHLTMFYDTEWYNGFTAVAVGFDLYHKVGGKLEAWGVDDFSNETWTSYITYLNPGRKETGPMPGSDYKETASGNFYYLESDKWYAIDTPFKIIKFYGDGYMRFLRNQFNLKFVMDDEVINEQDVYFETDLGLERFTSISEGLTPPAGYVFGGWFTSPTLTEDTRFNLETNIMPANDMILYGKWAPINVELDVHVTIDGTDEIIEGFNGFTVRYGSIVKKEQVDELKASVNIPEDAIWYGWYERVNVGGGKTLLVPFNFDKQLIEDLVLYPFYSYITPVKIQYDLNGGTGTTPVDEFNYALGRGAVVLSNADINPPDNKIFIGWNTKADGYGKSYYPGDIAVIDSDELKLYAIYGDKPEIGEVSLTYVNTISTESISFNYREFDTVTIFDDSVFSTPISMRYVFKEWNTKADGTGDSFNVGDSVVLTADSENILYAIYTALDLPILNIPIAKTLMRYKDVDSLTFGFMAKPCDINGLSINDVEFVGYINVIDDNKVVGNIEIPFKESELVNDNIFYYKVYEVEDFSKPIIYDKNYYIVEVKIVSNVPEIVNVNKYDEFGNQIPEFIYKEELSFHNTYISDLDVLPNTGGNGQKMLWNFGILSCILGLICFYIYIKRKIEEPF